MPLQDHGLTAGEVLTPDAIALLKDFGFDRGQILQARIKAMGFGMTDVLRVLEKTSVEEELTMDDTLHLLEWCEQEEKTRNWLPDVGK